MANKIFSRMPSKLELAREKTIRKIEELKRKTGLKKKTFSQEGEPVVAVFERKKQKKKKRGRKTKTISLTKTASFFTKRFF